MNIKKAVKKIVALGAGLTMIGATIMGASALSLADYPAPFVNDDGLFTGKIVVGAAAATSDVLGAIDISAGLQADAKTVIPGSSGTTVTVDDGVLIEDSSGNNLNYGDTTKVDKIDDNDFPTFLVDGEVEDDDSITYEFEQYLYVGNSTTGFDLLFGELDYDFYDMPQLYIDLDASGNPEQILTYVVDFKSSNELNWVGLGDSEDLSIFGKSFTFADITNTTTDLVLYGSDVTQLVTLNDPIDVEIDGETYTINVVGANSDTSSVHVSVNGVTKAMAQGDTKTISGLKIFVQDVFISTVGGESASANLFIGSSEWQLPYSTSWSQIEDENGDDIDGAYVKFTGNRDAIDKIEFAVNYDDLKHNIATTEDADYVELGNAFTDSLFGLKVNFLSASEAFTDGSYVDIKSTGDNIDFTFTNWDGEEYSFELYTKTGVNLTLGEDLVMGATALTKDNIFILHEDTSTNQPITKIYEFTGTDGTDSTETEAYFKDLATGKTITVSDDDTLEDTGVTVDASAGVKNAATLSSASHTYVYAQNGLWVNFTSSSNALNQDIVFDEDEKGNLYEEVAGTPYQVELEYSASDKEINIEDVTAVGGGTAANIASGNDEGDDYTYYLTKYGTYMQYETDEDTELEIWVPSETLYYRLFLELPTATITSSTGTGNGYAVNPIAVGLGVLDNLAPTLGSTPMIVVGGPCANTVAAELMGNPANCVEGFEEGKAIIKFYEDKNAILVAGFSAQDTQGASRVLADYADYDLTGTEVEVLVPSLSSISVNPVA